MSSGQFEFGSTPELPKMETKKKKEHKYSFQTGTNPEGFKRRRQEERHSFGVYEAEGGPQSKSIKIELEQTQNFDEKRQRKDSYKLKITTFREYDIEGNPNDLFSHGQPNNDADIFDYFAKKAKQEEEYMNGEKEEEQEYMQFEKEK